MKIQSEKILRTRRRKGPVPARRGSVIVLVVAVLALLAVIGTVYIVSARAGRSSAAAANVAVNSDLARDAVNAIAIQPIGDSMYDANGIIGGYAYGNSTGAPGPTNPGADGYHSARTYDMPEGDPAAFFTNPPFPFASSSNFAQRDESWLADGIYRPLVTTPYDPYEGKYPTGFNGPADGRYSALSILTPGLFDPADGQYDIPIYQSTSTTGTNGGTYYPPIFTKSFQLFQVVAPNLTSGGVRIPIPLGSGRNPVNADADAYINLLPFSDASGIRYRYGVRIVDTSSMLNLNVGMSYGNGAPDAAEINGTYFNAYNLSWFTNQNINTAFNSGTQLASSQDAPDAMVKSNAGRLGSWSPAGSPANLPLDYVWSRAALALDAVQPTAAQMPINPFDLGDELELRSYGALGSTILPRFASLWPNTLANQTNTGIVLNYHRNYYTTYSWSRDLRPFAATGDTVNVPNVGPYLTPAAAALVTPYTLSASNRIPNVPMTGTTPWPPFPACASANPETSSYLIQGIQTVDPVTAADRIAAAATNIASAMKMTGYTDAEARAFAVNYLTYRWNSWTNTGAGGSYTLPAGPSIMDAQGLCSRNSAISNFDYISNTAPGALNAETGTPTPTANKVLLGYAAQPFLNEVVVTITQDVPGPPDVPPAVADFAIELYNPYNVNMSLDGFGLRYHTATKSGVDYDFTGKNKYIPAGGYFVIAYSGGSLKGKIAAGAQKQDGDGSFSLPTLGTPPAPPATGNTGEDTSLYLMRAYYPRGVGPTGKASWGAVDHYDMSKLMAQQAVGAPQSFYVARSNANAANPNIWVAAVESTNSESTPLSDDKYTLGSANPYAPDKYADGAPPLYDRALSAPVNAALVGDTANPPQSAIQYYGANFDPRGTLANIADFNRIMRLCNEVDATTGLPVDNGTVSMQLPLIIPSPKNITYLNNCTTAIEARLHFDFAADNNMYSLPGVPAAPATVAGLMGDPRAVWLLDCLSFTDRVSDNLINVGFNGSAVNPGYGKMRIPGRINVNTAPPEVLENIPALTTLPNLLTSNNVSPITVILAYRWRTKGNDPRIPGPLQNSKIDFSTNFPGYGIRSMAELNSALAYAEIKLGFFNPNPSAPNLPATLDTRDQLWGDIYNFLTVRSDTFVLYGYLEAVKQNPRYQGAAFNANNIVWYGNTYGADITDDPADPNIAIIPLLRVARRRWVAIVDRSGMNYNLNDPRLNFPGATSAKPRIVAMRDLPQ